MKIRRPHIGMLRTRCARSLLALLVAAALALTALGVTAGHGRDTGRPDADRAGQDRDQGRDADADSGQGEEDEDDGGRPHPPST